MALIKYTGTNLAIGELLGWISNSSWTLILATWQGGLFPSAFPFKLKIEQFDGQSRVVKREIVKCTNRSSDTFTIVRSHEACPADYTALTQTTTAFAFNSWDTVSLIVTADTLDDIQDEIQTKLATAGGTMTGVLWLAQGTTISSASTVNLANATGNNLTVSWTATITAFWTVTAWAEFTLTFSGILILTHNGTSLILPTSANITTAVWDVAKLLSLGGGNWKCTSYLRSDGSALTTSNVESTVTTMTAWETITSGNALRIGNASLTTVENQTQSTGWDTTNNFIGYSNTYYTVWQSFTLINSLNNPINNIALYLARNDFTTAPNVVLSLKLYSDAWTTLIATSTNTIDSATDLEWYITNYTKCTFNFSSVVVPSVFYAKINIDSWSLSTSYYVMFDWAGSSVYSWWDGSNINNANAWTGRTKDLKFIINDTYSTTYETAWRAYKTDARDPLKSWFVWFANNSETVGNSVYLSSAGINATQSWLTPSSVYYITNTAGSISTTPWTTITPVWRAISATKIQIDSSTWIKTQAIITPTVGASPYTYQNITWKLANVSVTWGTVSAIEISRDNSSFYQIASATNTHAIIGINDYVKITYSSTPVVKIFTL